MSMSVNVISPRTTLRRPYMAAGGALVPQEEGIYRGCKTIYVDQVNGLNANNGRTWATAKQTIFGATGAMSVVADGDSMVVVPGHNEALAAPQNIALNFIKVLLKGTTKQTYLNGLGRRINFSGFRVTVSGDGNEIYDVVSEGITVSGDDNFLFNCVSEVPAWVISGNGNYLEMCGGIINTLSGALNWIVDHGNSAMTLSATATQNIILRPHTNLTTAIICAGGSTGNVFLDIDIGTNSWTVTDLGANYVMASARSSSRFVEVFYPTAGIAAHVAGGAGLYQWGGAVAVMAAGFAPATDYEFVALQAILNQVDDYEIQILDTSANVLGNFTCNNAAIGTRFNEKLLTPVRVRGGVGISANLRTAGGGSDSAEIRIKYRA